jgi:hypothetical protein
MIHDTWQPHALPIQVTLVEEDEASIAGGRSTISRGTVAGTVSVSAQASENRSVIALRVTNFGVHLATVRFKLLNSKDDGASFSLEDAAVTCWQLSSPKLTDANTPGQPGKIVPEELHRPVSLEPLVVPAFSFTTCEVLSTAE